MYKTDGESADEDEKKKIKWHEKAIWNTNDLKVQYLIEGSGVNVFKHCNFQVKLYYNFWFTKLSHLQSSP